MNKEKKEQTLLEVIEKMKVEKDSKEYCLYITKSEINKEDFKSHQKNVKATKYFADINEQIPTKVVAYEKYKEEIDEYFNLDFLPKLLYINDFEILASLPVFNFSILEQE